MRGKEKKLFIVAKAYMTVTRKGPRVETCPSLTEHMIVAGVYQLCEHFVCHSCRSSLAIVHLKNQITD